MQRRIGIARVLLACCLALATLPPLHAQQLATAEAFDIPAAAGAIEVPFRLSHNHLVMRLAIDDQPLDIVLDTGMPVPGVLLFDNANVRKLPLRFSSQQAVIGGAGNGQQMTARIATGVDIDIGVARLNNVNVIVPPPLEHFDDYVDGIIGMSLLRRFAVHIDYDRGVLELHEPDTYTPPEGAHMLTVKLRGGVPFAQLGLMAKPGRRVPIEVAVDLGASHTVSLNAHDSDKIAIPDSAIHALIGRGLSGPVHGRVGRIAALEIAGVQFDDVVATFPDADVQHPSNTNSRNGNLGSGILKRFNLTIDYANDRLVLMPNEGFDEPFEWGMSGMRLQVRGKRLSVDDLIANSPAAHAGVAVDDVITHIDGKPVTSDDSEDVRKLMERHGATIEVTLLRDGKPRTFEMTLRRLV